MKSALTWFEIPSVDFDRAVKFYSDLLGTPLNKTDYNGIPHGIFPYEEGGIGGAVVKSDGYVPNLEATVVYLNAGDETSLDAILARAESAGGKVIMPKTHIGEPGYIALVLDSEGNRIGLNTQS